MMKKLLAILCFSSLAALLSGCGPYLHVTQYPDFWDANTQYSSAAVVQTADPIGSDYAGDYSEHLLYSLHSNGTYNTYDYRFNGNPDQVMQVIREDGEAELVIYTTLSDLSTSTYTETRYYEETYPVYVVDEDGYQVLDEDGYPIVDHEEVEQIPYPWYNIDSSATVSSTVVRAGDEQILHQSKQYGSCHDDAGDPDNLMTHYDMAQCALRDAASDLVQDITPHYEVIRIDPKDVMQIYRSKNGSWKRDDEFTMEDQYVLIKMSMPYAARLNTFGVDIIVAGDKSENEIFREDFTWESGKVVEYNVPVSALIQNSNGSHKFEIRLINNSSIAFSQKITIE